MSTLQDVMDFLSRPDDIMEPVLRDERFRAKLRGFFDQITRDHGFLPPFTTANLKIIESQYADGLLSPTADRLFTELKMIATDIRHGGKGGGRDIARA